MSTKISDRWAGVVSVEYECRGMRVLKRFTDPYAARRFYVTKLKAGRHPAVKRK